MAIRDDRGHLPWRQLEEEEGVKGGEAKPGERGLAGAIDVFQPTGEAERWRGGNFGIECSSLHHGCAERKRKGGRVAPDPATTRGSSSSFGGSYDRPLLSPPLVFGGRRRIQQCGGRWPPDLVGMEQPSAVAVVVAFGRRCRRWVCEEEEKIVLHFPEAEIHWSSIVAVNPKFAVAF
uniref:Uncharacterized protein n=1 Tax=Oryza sativa subsp. japonica TaxID=39947 RepID=Q75IC3_ORYSJ|nr:hypothetical protein [Oryza sativa Japonica Group]